jgi:ABC-type multidrug transport system ATPase subunit
MSGQSTLLQLLAGRKLPAGPMAGFYRSGDLLFAGRPADATSRSNVAFVEQEDDWHLPSLTVRETLRYAAILRLPDKMPRRQKIARAETVLLMLGLKDCADLPVGGQLLKGISGGEKRRLSLAVQSAFCAVDLVLLRLATDLSRSDQRPGRVGGG